MSSPQFLDLTEDSFVLDEMQTDDILADFTCFKCSLIAINPVKCDRCEKIYCSACVNTADHTVAEVAATDADAITMDSLFDESTETEKTAPPQPPKKTYTCLNKCGSSKTIELSRIERNLLNSLSFKCQHAEEHGCQSVVRYEHYRQHLAIECVHPLKSLRTVSDY